MVHYRRNRRTITSSQKHTGNALPGYTFGYGFDTIGNRETATRESTTENYAPNALNQIESIDHAGLLHLLGSADAAATLTLNGTPTTRTGELFYHALSGNNTFESVTLTGTLTGAGHNGTDAVSVIEGEAYIPAGPTARTHDESGNLVEDARWLYTWDAENRLVQIETRPTLVTAGAPHRRLTFEYDSQSRRTRKTVETWVGTEWQTNEDIRFLWNDWLPTAELRGSTLEPIRTYTWSHDIAGSRDMTGGVGGLARIRHHQTNEVTVPLYGPNGNVWSYWNIDQEATVATFQYGPFGELIAASGAEQDRHRFRFSTKYEDPATGYLYYGFRFYDPETGRWLNRDPIEEDGGLNIYRIAQNSLLNNIELFGLCWSNARAVAHYMANGGDVTLAQTGCVGAVTSGIGSTTFDDRWARVHEIAIEEIEGYSCTNESTSWTKEGKFGGGSNSGVFWIGGIYLETRYECEFTPSCGECKISYKCKIENVMDDPFEEPLNFNGRLQINIPFPGVGGSSVDPFNLTWPDPTFEVGFIFRVNHTWEDEASNTLPLK